MTAQLARIAGLLWAERRPYLIGSLFVATSIVTALAYPYVIRLIIDEAIQRGQLQRLNQLSLVMVGIVLVEALSTCGRDYCFGPRRPPPAAPGLRVAAASGHPVLRQPRYR
ncbi:MAG: hypothetical protein DMF97_18925 [Acidobacteria bacterium]|nr:MAG: hypothetical protein DMF97_18925 [Acidobacteriota bacterium]